MTETRKDIRKLIIEGCKAYRDEDAWYFEGEMISGFFKSITTKDLEHAIFMCEQGEQEDLDYSGKLLFAYFNWCKRYEVHSLASGDPVDRYRLKFFDLICEQACNYQQIGGEDSSFRIPKNGKILFELPEWSRPKLFQNFPERLGARPKNTYDRSFSLYTLYLSARKLMPNLGKREVAQSLAGDIGIKGIGYKVIERAIAEIEKEGEGIEYSAANVIIKNETTTSLINYFKKNGTLIPLRKDK